MSELSIKKVKKPLRRNQKPKVYPRPKNMRPKKPTSFWEQVKKKWKIYLGLPGSGLGIMPRPGEYSGALRTMREMKEMKEKRQRRKK